MFMILIVFSSAYNGDICNDTYSPCGGGCTSTDLSLMFSGVTDFDNTVGDITEWNTSCVTNMAGLFDVATDFNQDISGWDVSVVIDMNGMFYYASSFNKSISVWNVSNVADMSGMFDHAISFNHPLNDWNTASLETSQEMFQYAETFNQDISDWNVTSLLNANYMFYNITLSTDNYDALLNGWASQIVNSNVLFSGGNSKYSVNALLSRNTLIEAYGWNITDSGLYEVDNDFITGNTINNFNPSGMIELFIGLFAIILVIGTLFVFTKSEQIEGWIAVVVIVVVIIVLLALLSSILFL
jgi:surface protein